MFQISGSPTVKILLKKSNALLKWCGSIKSLYVPIIVI